MQNSQYWSIKFRIDIFRTGFFTKESVKCRKCCMYLEYFKICVFLFSKFAKFEKTMNLGLECTKCSVTRELLILRLWFLCDYICITWLCLEKKNSGLEAKVHISEIKFSIKFLRDYMSMKLSIFRYGTITYNPPPPRNIRHNT